MDVDLDFVLALDVFVDIWMKKNEMFISGVLEKVSMEQVTVVVQVCIGSLTMIQKMFLMKIMIKLHQIFRTKQAENGLQSRSSENGSVALWIKIAVILNWR